MRVGAWVGEEGCFPEDSKRTALLLTSWGHADAKKEQCIESSLRRKTA